MSGGAAVVYRWELVKLAAQLKLRLALLSCLLVPFGVALLLGLQGGLPKDTLFGRHIRESGYALPLVLLGFAGTWVLPLLTSIVAGDIFAAEDRHATWKSIMTRSVSREDLFTGKVAAATATALSLLALTAVSSLGAGLLLAGSRPLIGLTGQTIPPGHGVLLVLAGWASVLPPLLGFTALSCLISIVTRNSVAGVGGPVVIGLLMTLLAIIDGLAPAQHLLLTAPFFAWHGLLQPHPYYGPLLQGVGVSVLYAVIALAVARRRFLRRDTTGS